MRRNLTRVLFLFINSLTESPKQTSSCKPVKFNGYQRLNCNGGKFFHGVKNNNNDKKRHLICQNLCKKYNKVPVCNIFFLIKRGPKWVFLVCGVEEAEGGREKTHKNNLCSFSDLCFPVSCKSAEAHFLKRRKKRRREGGEKEKRQVRKAPLEPLARSYYLEQRKESFLSFLPRMNPL